MVKDWIPVSERLPEEDGEYLVTTCWELFDEKYVRTYEWANDLYKISHYAFPKHESGWCLYNSDYGYIEQDDVIAWQPLPEAYTEVK